MGVADRGGVAEGDLSRTGSTEPACSGCFRSRPRGASAIHSAEDTSSGVSTSGSSRSACGGVRPFRLMVTVWPLTSTAAFTRSPGRTVGLTGTAAAGTISPPGARRSASCSCRCSRGSFRAPRAPGDAASLPPSPTQNAAESGGRPCRSPSAVSQVAVTSLKLAVAPAGATPRSRTSSSSSPGSLRARLPSRRRTPVHRQLQPLVSARRGSCAPSDPKSALRSWATAPRTR